jgi:hypothetical protein
MSFYINQLSILDEIETTHWLIIDTPGETKRVNIGALQSFFGNIKKVNEQTPNSDGNVNLTTDHISDLTSEKKFINVELLNLISILDKNGDGALFLANDGTYKAPAGSGGGTWGSIVGSMSDQTDLAAALGGLGNGLSTIAGQLANKQDMLSFTPEDAAMKGAANGYAPLDENGLIPSYILPSTSNVSYRVAFRFNSDLYTEDEALFRGVISNLAGYFNNALSTVTFAARTESGTYVACSTLAALQTWINSNVIGDSATGTKYFIKVLATYSSSGIAEYILTYKE